MILVALGGRKFLMALACVGVAVFLELRGGPGLTTVMASFLVSIVGLFSVANYASAAKHADTSKLNSGDFKQTLERVEAKIDNAMSVEQTNTLQQLLTGLVQGVNDVKGTTGQLGQAVVNIGNQLTKRN